MYIRTPLGKRGRVEVERDSGSFERVSPLLPLSLRELLQYVFLSSSREVSDRGNLLISGLIVPRELLDREENRIPIKQSPLTL